MQTWSKATNENPYPPSPKVLEAIRSAADETLRLYPDPEASQLRQTIAEYHGLTPEQVFCGNGSDEVLGLCFYAFFSPGRRVIFPDITYSFYPVYAHLFQLDFEEIPLNEDFSFPVEKFLRGSGGAVVCNPNAPTGRTLPLEEICRELAEGNIAADPFWRGPDHNACQWCEYAAACHFEEGRGGDRRRFLPAVRSEEFWQAVAKEQV